MRGLAYESQPFQRGWCDDRGTMPFTLLLTVVTPVQSIDIGVAVTHNHVGPGLSFFAMLLGSQAQNVLLLPLTMTDGKCAWILCLPSGHTQ